MDDTMDSLPRDRGLLPQEGQIYFYNGSGYDIFQKDDVQTIINIHAFIVNTKVEVAAIIASLGGIGNLYVATSIAYFGSTKLRRNATFHIILYQALVFLCVLLPAHLMKEIALSKDTNSSNNTACKIERFTSACHWCTSSMCLVLIGLERYAKSTYPKFYKHRFTSRVKHALLGCVMFTTFMLALLYHSGRYEQYNSLTAECEFSLQGVTIRKTKLLNLVLLFWVPGAIVLLVYSLTWLRILKASNAVRRRKYFKNSLRLTTLFSLSSLAFFLCWLPMAINRTAEWASTNRDSYFRWLLAKPLAYIICQLSPTLAMLYTVINPIMLVSRSERLRKPAKKLMRLIRLLDGRDEEEEQSEEEEEELAPANFSFTREHMLYDLKMGSELVASQRPRPTLDTSTV